MTPDRQRLGVKFCKNTLVFDIHKHVPLPSRAALRVCRLRGTVPTTFPEVASITVESLLLPLNVKIRLVRVVNNGVGVPCRDRD